MATASPLRNAPALLTRVVECESCGGDGRFACCDASERGHFCLCLRPTVDCRACGGTGEIEEFSCARCGERADEDGSCWEACS